VPTNAYLCLKIALRSPSDLKKRPQIHPKIALILTKKAQQADKKTGVSRSKNEQIWQAILK